MFWEGKTSGKAARMEIVDRPDHTLLVDFGWAVLAKRNKRTGKVTFYEGWKGYSRTTSKHINQSGLYRSDSIEGRQLKINDPIPSDFQDTYLDVIIDKSGSPRLTKRK